MYIFKCGLQPMNHEIAQRPDQHTGNSTPYSLRYVGPARVRTHDLLHGSPVLNQLSQPVGGYCIYFQKIGWGTYDLLHSQSS